MAEKSKVSELEEKLERHTSRGKALRAQLRRAREQELKRSLTADAKVARALYAAYPEMPHDAAGALKYFQKLLELRVIDDNDVLY